MSKKVKIFALVVIGLALIIGGFTFFGGGGPAPVTPYTQSANSPLSNQILPGSLPVGPGIGFSGGANASAANDFSGLLSSINSITVDTSLFTNPAYQALRDYPVILGTDVVGRVNPFAPVGTDSATDTIITKLTTETLAPGKVTSTSAELGALMTLPDNTATGVVFQYGTTDTFGSATTPITTTKSGTILTTITGLQPNTTYKVQAVAVRGATTTNGNTVSFTTTSASR